MATYLVLEDGTGITGANSYSTVDEFQTYITERGLSVAASSDHDYMENLLIKAADYLQKFRAKYKGDKSSSTQGLAWPRTNVYIDGFAISGIPTELKYAQLQLAYDADSTDLQPTIAAQDKGNITKEKLGPLEKTYDNSGSRRSTPAFSKAQTLITPLLNNGGLAVLTRS